MPAGFASVRVLFLPMPSGDYRVAVTITSIGPIAGPSGTCEELIDGCVNIQVSGKTMTQLPDHDAKHGDRGALFRAA